MANVEMGAFVVLRVYKTISPQVILITKTLVDAEQYANIMKRAEPDYDFAVSRVQYMVTTDKI